MMVLKTLEERCDPRWSALLVVDVQNDFASPKGAAAERGEDMTDSLAMVPRLVRLIDAARAVGLTNIYIQTIHGEWTDTPSWMYRASQQKKLNSCREGTWGAEFFEGIRPLPSERIVNKHRYSAFINTDLNTVLRAKGIESVLVTGIATNVCVETTARDAYMFDYYVTLIGDCAAAYDRKSHEGTLENIRRHFGLVADSDEIIRIWEGLGRKKAAAR
ncbi:MAG TPA: isochorismatase family cysteine hydrolase [Candidatus Binatia bacterium]